MASTNTPNMSLIVPVVGQEPGPDYAIDINNDLQILDQHDHTSGRGVQITPGAININASLSFANNLAIDLAGLTLNAQSVAPGNNTVYRNGVDLYFVDGVGNNVRITQSGGVAGSPGSISNLNSPASAAYVSGNQTFVWQSGANVAANMDFGAAILRNLSPNSTFALTLQPPTLSSNYTITLPTLPLSESFVSINSSGLMAASTPVLGSLTTANLSSSANILGSQLDAAANIVGTQLSASAGIVGTQLSASAAIAKTQMVSLGQQIATSSGGFTVTGVSDFVTITNQTVTLTTSGRPVMLTIYGQIGVSGGGTVSQGRFRIFRDGATTVNDVSLRTANSAGGADIFVGAGSMNCIDTPAAGSHTYVFQAFPSSPATASANAVRLVAWEL